MEDKAGIWLNKFISETGICSRREADKLIEQGLVTINGQVAGKVEQVMPGDIVAVDGQELEHRDAEDIVFIALNKPEGIICTTEQYVPDNIVDFVNHTARIFPIGRLDKDSRGLIFLTNNGDMVNKILRAGNNHEKEYVVAVDKPLSDSDIRGMSQGVPMLGTVTQPCKIVKEGAKSFRVVLQEGLNRQIRRMCAHYGYQVTRLERVRIMNVRVKGLPLGDWRDLTPEEMSDLYDLTKHSASAPPEEAANSLSKNASPAPAKRSGTNTPPKPGGKRTSGKRIGKSKPPKPKPSNRFAKTSAEAKPKPPTSATSKPPSGIATSKPKPPTSATGRPTGGTSTSKPKPPTSATGKPSSGKATSKPKPPGSATGKPPRGKATSKPKPPTGRSPQPKSGKGRGK